MIPAIRNSDPLTPRAMRPCRLMLGLKNRVTQTIYHIDFPWQATGIQADLGRGSDESTFPLGLDALGRCGRWLFDLWLEAKGGYSPRCGRCNDCRFNSTARVVDDTGLHRHHIRSVVAAETGLLKNKQKNRKPIFTAFGFLNFNRAVVYLLFFSAFKPA